MTASRRALEWMVVGLVVAWLAACIWAILYL